MALNKQSGNMYDFVTHMWSPVKGLCEHFCNYCYMRRFPLPPLHIDERDLRTNLGKDNFIFVGHTVDLFAKNVPSEWIERVLERCRQFPTNKYLFQSKNPIRFMDFIELFPEKVVFGTTIETNRPIYVESKAPPYIERADAIGQLGRMEFETIITIEPIFDFDLKELSEMIISANPTWINIGADSKRHNLPEPPKAKIIELINTLKAKIDVKLKNNLKRILEQPDESIRIS